MESATRSDRLLIGARFRSGFAGCFTRNIVYNSRRPTRQEPKSGAQIKGGINQNRFNPGCGRGRDRGVWTFGGGLCRSRRTRTRDEKKVDEIKARGELNAAVLAEPPWLAENTTGSGPQYFGSAWMITEEIAKRLGVKIAVTPVSHETKIPILATGQVDVRSRPWR